MSPSAMPPGFVSLTIFTVRFAVRDSLPYCAVTCTSPPLSPTAVTMPSASIVTTDPLSTVHFALTLVPFDRRSKSTVLPTPFVTTISAPSGVIESAFD